MAEEKKELSIAEQIEKITNERKEKEIKAGFLNPFGEKTTYAEFQKALGKATVAEYCKGKLSDEEIAFIEKELSILNQQ